LIGNKRGTVFVPAADSEYTLANEIKSDYNTHRVSTSYHVVADSTNTVDSTNATSLVTVLTLVNEIKADYNAHLILSGVHNSNDIYNKVEVSDAIDESTVFALVNDIKRKYTAHIANTSFHKLEDTGDRVSSQDAGDDAPEIDFNADGGSALVELTGASGWDGTVDFQTTPDGSTFFNIPYISRSTITPTPSVAQISSPTTAAIYLLLGPLSQVRIAVGAGASGSVTVVYRTITSEFLVPAYLAAGTNVIGKIKNDPTFSTATGSSALTLATTPGAIFRLLRVELHLNTAPTQETFAINLDAGDGSDYDVVLYSEDMSVDTPTDVIVPFGEGYEFEADDAIDLAWTNTDTRTYGARVVYELL
tara:strand:+ start:2164 stop:3249 length:1086 start_codon:yes stop_codon:yes gene_type:complete